MEVKRLLGFARKTSGDFGYARGWEISDDGIVYVAHDRDSIDSLLELVSHLVNRNDLPGHIMYRIRKMQVSLQDIQKLQSLQNNGAIMGKGFVSIIGTLAAYYEIAMQYI